MRVALLYGGRSAEHDVSVASAISVYQALLEAKHEVIPIAITLEGNWYKQTKEPGKEIERNAPLSLKPGEGLFLGESTLALDAAFATTHGYGGEDGNLQGLCMLCGIPLAGCDTVSSAIGMHKDLASRLFNSYDIPTVATVVLDRFHLLNLEAFVMDHFTRITKQLGPHLFVKPENAGSSVGVRVLKDAQPDTLVEALRYAALFSERVLIQTLMEEVQEVECAALRTMDGKLRIAGPAAVIDPAKQEQGFLSYEHKYGSSNTAYLELPSTVEEATAKEIRRYAKQAFLAIKADGYARIDFFLAKEGIFLNEINTSPGMTLTSHYPKLMASIGYTMSEVLDHLLYDALARAKEERGRIYRPPTL
ncbi:D-alanine--D-alanine ligase A [bioreactor metagenome]|uniref:D-alanine--D-alanine ligase A n=1 Tax=bioreactor metagenome TaxID=1076179 RepID=A0A644ZFV4_9ZZZZ|nr:D-alanine--D-alanine ligase [Sphaerochaeta sp.]